MAKKKPVKAVLVRKYIEVTNNHLTGEISQEVVAEVPMDVVELDHFDGESATMTSLTTGKSTKVGFTPQFSANWDQAFGGRYRPSVN